MHVCSVMRCIPFPGGFVTIVAIMWRVTHQYFLHGIRHTSCKASDIRHAQHWTISHAQNGTISHDGIRHKKYFMQGIRHTSCTELAYKSCTESDIIHDGIRHKKYFMHRMGQGRGT